MVATPVLPLAHVPPEDASVRVMEKPPAQTVPGPLMLPGTGLTVNTVTDVQPPIGRVYVTAVVPEASAESMPEVEPIVAVTVLPLLHVPPMAGSVSGVNEPWHTGLVPTIASGEVLTVTTMVAIQPVGKVYVIIALPVDDAVTTPVAEPTGAIPLLLLLHVPPVVASLRLMTRPAQPLARPVIFAGSGLTVNSSVAVQPAGNVYVIMLYFLNFLRG